MAHDGLIVVDKPGGMTSHDVVARIRRIAGTRRVGHAGTLDPMATGVLVIGVERATRLLTFLVGSDKVYLATIRLGQSTITDDAEGDITASVSTADLASPAVRAAVGAFVGPQEQVPSSVSAIKVGGVRSYARVRQGERVELAARRVTIHRLDVHGLTRTTATDNTAVIDLDVEVACSSGTYIRAIARDLGARLGVGGHLTALRRTAVGAFTLAEASTMDDLVGLADPVTIPLDRAAATVFARRDADPDEARVLSHGGPLRPIGRADPYAVFGPDGRVIAIVAEREGSARAQVVLAPAGTRSEPDGTAGPGDEGEAG